MFKLPEAIYAILQPASNCVLKLHFVDNGNSDVKGVCNEIMLSINTCCYKFYYSLQWKASFVLERKRQLGLIVIDR